MYNVTHHTRKFDTEDREDLEEYDSILNDPLCSIINERREKLTTREMDDEGNVVSMTDKVILVVTWQQKTLS